MSLLAEHLEKLTGYRDRDVMDAALVEGIRDMLRPRRVGIYRVVGEDDERRWLTRATLEAGQPVTQGDPLWIDMESLPKLDMHPLRAAAMLQEEPIIHMGNNVLTVFALATDREVVGVLEIETVVRVDPEHLRLVLSILRIYRNFQALLDYSERDTLTGLLNRKTFDEAFYKVLAISALPARDASEDRRELPFPPRHYLGVIDIDHFKRVNDTYGHLIGDEVLLLLSRLMRSSFRFYDKLYRFGGEEFVVLLRCGPASDAVRAFERLRASVQAYAFPKVGQITVSTGFTQVRPNDTPNGAFARADRAVYWAKDNGRNRVCHHADLPALNASEELASVGDIELF